MKSLLLNDLTNEDVTLNSSLTGGLVIGNRIPMDYFVTKGTGESDITIHAGSYHLALQKAGIEKANIMTYSSILPAIAKKIKKPDDYVHGSVMETILASANGMKGEQTSAGIIYGWLINKKTGEKYGGLVCEQNGNYSKKVIREMLIASLDELYTNGFEEHFFLQKTELITESFVPEKKYGTALVALCFTNYYYPVINNQAELFL
jgi:arginine decarboxylase